jgi:tetratricopeptide (TPR) repeat protein
LKDQKDSAQSTLKKMQELFPDKYLFVEAVAFFEKKFDTEFFNTEEKIRRLEKYPEFNLMKVYISPEDMPLKTALEARKILDELGGNDFKNFDEKSYLWYSHKQYDSALHYANSFLNYWENNSDSLLVYLHTFPLNSYTNVADVLCVLKRYDEALVCLKKGDYLRSMPKLNLNMGVLTANIAYEQMAALSYKGLNQLDTAFAIYEKLVTKWGAEQFADSLKNLYSLRFPDAKENFEDYYARIRGKKVYPNAPIVDLNLLRGNEKIKVGGESTEIYVLNFWGIFCQPCIKEFPLLNELTEKYQSFNQIKFISITNDSPEALNKFFLKKQFKYNHAHSAFDAIRTYEAIEIPVNLIIDKKGKIIFRHVGYDKDIVNKISEVLDNLIVNGDY